MSDSVVEDAAWNAFTGFTSRSQPHEVIQGLRAMGFPEDRLDALLARHELKAREIIQLREPLGISREGRVPWYIGPRSGDVNWPPLEKRLVRKLGSESAAKIDAASSKVVAMLDHPATPEFAAKGLVVGHVQSGKTSNFTAVICKAADRGYRMFIVLSGVHNALRAQTQARLVSDIVGANPTFWHQITSAERDFVPPANAASLLAVKDQALLLVVKKNAVVLRKLRRWLLSASEHLAQVPTLIIDDEADQATVATKTINPLIADIVEGLPKVCYVGYTATPFANLVIDPSDERDFYPRDFVLSLERPSSYQGPETLFGRRALDGEDPADVPGGLDVIRDIAEEELPDLRPRSRADIPGFAPRITDSLRDALLWFWLATAARRCRSGTAEHSSMLVHAHSDTRVHDSYAEPLRQFRSLTLGALRSGDTRLETELRRLWHDETSRVPASELGESPLAFADVFALLTAVVSDTDVILDHYRSQDRLNYDGGPRTVIAVGGNTLSRGLTLEGLVVSFFVRSADVYDTLLQMGRWFGYRPGYSDLPRIWMPAQLRDWYAHLATVEEEIRREIDRYLVEHKSPLDLAVRIRSHPKMRISAAGKMTNAVRAAAAYGGELVESRYFPVAPKEEAGAWLDRNAAAVNDFLTRCAIRGREDSATVPASTGKVLWRGVSSRDVVTFLESYSFHERSVEADRDLLVRYIDGRVRAGGLKSWNVAVMGQPTARALKVLELPHGASVGMVRRSRLKNSPITACADIKTLSGSRDEAIDLVVSAGAAKLGRTGYARLRVEQTPETGLVLLYPIDPLSPTTLRGREELDAPADVVWGAALVFPQPSVGSDLPVHYDFFSADLSGIFPALDEDDEVDLAILDEDLDGVESDA
ncbi:MAG: Z1 domain-containing protein [Cellulomonas sp.]|uniref:Z1 domain-containing protein n=1 Tax=Cellulomonas sp. TaxID=40001 RepID=UPI001A04A93E|nr:Z1 domain-containing protein [Cellulomonas sp.]MBF0688427.1 Z1 domain-containing protein [Cellulomonas sp.]